MTHTITNTEKMDQYTICKELRDDMNDSLIGTVSRGLSKYGRLSALLEVLVGEIIFDEHANEDAGFTSKAKVRERLGYVLDNLAKLIVRDHGDEGECLVSARLSTEEAPDIEKLRREMRAMLKKPGKV
jgi:hypothetical protein